MKNIIRVKVEINLSRIRQNALNIKSHINPSTQIIAVIKSQAYGHGMIKTAQTLSQIGIKNFAIATIDEAKTLKQHGIKGSILILGASFPSTITDIIKLKAQQTVYSLSQAARIQQTAASLNTAAHIQIAIDTGMNRLGFAPTQKTTDQINQILRMPNIRTHAIYSHLASSDSPDPAYTNLQTTRFQFIVSKLKNPPPTHISNSGAILNHSHLNYDFVRSGILLYGIYPSPIPNNPLNIKPALTLKSVISFIQKIPIGECVSYNSKFKAARPTTVATIPIGYADGIRKELGCGKGRVFINKKYAPIIGEICMDQFMVDVTDIKNINIDDEVEIIGQHITVQEIAAACGTIPYEIICGIPDKVPRIYKE